MEPRSTIGPNPNFDVDQATERLKKAMRGIGSDEKMIIKVLIEHNSLQREEIEQRYKQMYGQDLLEDLRSELGGHFEETVVALLTSPYDYLVTALNKSFRMIGSDVNTLTEILCGKDSASLSNISWWYEKNFGLSLANALSTNLSGYFRNLMVSIAAGARPQDGEVNTESAKEDAQKLYDAGVGLNMGTEEAVFTHLMSNASYEHLKEVFVEYEKISSESIEAAISSEFSGDVKDGLLAIVKYVQDPYGFFAERLNKCMLGSGTDDETLTRIIVSRSEVDLGNIADRYLEMYGTSLVSDIREDTDGDYSKILIAIISGSPHPTAPVPPPESEEPPTEEVYQQIMNELYIKNLNLTTEPPMTETKQHQIPETDQQSITEAQEPPVTETKKEQMETDKHSITEAQKPPVTETKKEQMETDKHSITDAQKPPLPKTEALLTTEEHMTEDEPITVELPVDDEPSKTDECRNKTNLL